jgi:PAS domain-containing protein
VGLVARGLPNKAIGAALGLTERSVKARLQRLFVAMGAANRAELVAITARRLARSRALGLVIQNPTRPQLESYRSAPFGMVVLRGPEHLVTFFNETAQEVSGYAEERVIGHTLAEVFDAKPDDPFVAKLDEVLRTGMPLVAERQPLTWRDQDGAPRGAMLDFFAHPLVHLGTISGLLVVGHTVVALMTVVRLCHLRW